MVEAEDLKPGELIAVNKESFIVYEKLPPEYDSRVMAMEVDERPTEDYTDIGGLDKQIEELTEAIVLPMTHKERFENIGIRPPKGLLLHGPPGTGKTLMARACAAQTKATFLKLAGPQLVQMYIGDGAKMIRDAFELAREKAPAIIFIDELDAIGTKRGAGEGETREVHRTMLELLNQLDGFSQHDDIKVIAATNRPDILDPALLRSGRLDRKVELPPPNEPLPEDIELRISRLVAPAAAQATGKAQQQQQMEQQQKQMQDPILQMQMQELQIKQADVQRKAQAEMAKIQLDMQKAMAKSQLDQAKLEQEREIQTAKIGAQIARDNAQEQLEEDRIASQEQIAGAKLGVDIAKDLMGNK